VESDFFELFESIQNQHPGFALEVGYNKVADWGVHVWDRKRHEDYTDDHLAVSYGGCDRKEVFAAAYAQLCEYMSETHGGY